MELIQNIKSRIAKGQLRTGSFLPSERELSESHSVARMTARRALKALEAEGFLHAEPGKGYRVLARGNDPTKGCPVAFALAAQEPGAPWRDFNLLLLQALQAAAERRSWPVLGVGAQGQIPERVIDQCKLGRAWGLVADVHRPDLVSLAARSGLPVVMVDAWVPSVDVDVVFQNGFLGGMQAVEYLVELDRRRIAWFGQVNWGVHSATRFSGAHSAMRMQHLTLEPGFEIDARKPDAEEALARLLRRPDRPDAILALWQPHMRTAAKVARELGLRIGTDLEIVGWTSEEQYDSAVASYFRGERVPPVVQWRIADMAEMAIDRLASRRANPAQPPVTIEIQTRIRPAEFAQG